MVLHLFLLAEVSGVYAHDRSSSMVIGT